MTSKLAGRAIRVIAAVLLLTGTFYSQEQEAKGICFAPGSKTAAVRGFIGGESHDSYIIHLKEGRKLTVRITSTRNRAEFAVTTTEFGQPVTFGAETNQGRVWTGTIPETGPYYIYVVAHPEARYTLRVTVE